MTYVTRELDTVDRILGQWNAVRPDLDVSPIAVVGRLSRLVRLIERRLDENFSSFGIESWMYDVMATLRRSGEPFELAAGDLVRQAMVTTGAITNRIDRLEQRGLVERGRTDDRRKVIVRLTPLGFEMVERVVEAHLDAERAVLSSLSARQRDELQKLTRTLLISLGDSPDV